MKTKRYIKPITTAVAAASSTILAGSGNTGEPSIPGGEEGPSPGEAEAKPFTGFGGFNEGGTEESTTKKGWQGWSTN